VTPNVTRRNAGAGDGGLGAHAAALVASFGAGAAGVAGAVPQINADNECLDAMRDALNRAKKTDGICKVGALIVPSPSHNNTPG
jgi:hypothetical protein